MNDFLYSSNNENKNFVNPLSLQVSTGTSKRLLVKPFFIQQRYADLDSFRQQIEQSKAGLHHQPFTSNKRNTAFYKTIFFGFAAIFFGLGLTAMAIPFSLGCAFFGTCTLLKGGIVAVCTILSLSAFTLGLRLKPEKEALAYYVRKTKTRISAIYARKKINAGIKSLFAFLGPNRLKAAALRQMYHDTLERINDKNEEAVHLAHRIVTAETLNFQEKEDLLNQAIEEFSEKLHLVVQSFRHALPLH
jgi:hypothetical protein